MSRTKKGIIAAAVGLGLLGSFGTFALWSDSAQLQGGTITAGNLELTRDETTTWSDISPATATGWTGTNVFDASQVGTAKAINDIADFRMVPGDLVKGSTTVTAIATGDNMKATLAIDPASVTIPAELQGKVSVAAALSDSSGLVLGTATLGEPLSWQITSATPASGTQYSVEIRVGFDGLTTGQIGVTQAIDLSDMALKLSQVR